MIDSFPKTTTLDPNSYGAVSTVNSTTAALGISATFTGTWEDVSQYASITVNGVTDATCTGYADFSSDGTNVDRVAQLSTGKDSTFGIHGLIPINKYMRVRVVNGAVAMTYLRLQTLYNHNARISVPTTRLQQSITGYSDALTVKVGNDPFLDYSRSAVGGRSVINKFGRNDSVTSTEVVISGAGSAYAGFLTAASTIRVKAGGNAADTAAGAGARSITIAGLDANWAVYSETVATAGASASAATTGTFTTVYRSYVEDCGAYSDGTSGSNTGNVDVETVGGALLDRISATLGQSQLATYTVPAGKTAYLMHFSATVDSNKPCTVRMFQRRNADVVTAPYSPRRIVHTFSSFVGHAVKVYKVYAEFPALTDIWVTGQMESAVTGAVDAAFDLILVDD